MPTGYTAPIHDDPDFGFTDFAARCARQFGALIMQRDEPMGAPLPERITADTGYYDRAEASAHATIKRLTGMAESERVAYGEAERSKTIARSEQRMRTDAEARARAAEIEAAARAWTPPTQDHTGLKEFMLQQLDADFGQDYGYDAERLDQARRMDALTIWAQHRQSAIDDYARARAGRVEELQRVAQRDAWLQALRTSLGMNDAA